MTAADWRLDVDLTLDLGVLHLRCAFSTAAPALAVVGASGAGKSTLLRALAGLEPRARGRVVAGGVTWQDDARGVTVPPWLRGVGWVPQSALLFPHLDVRANLAYAAPGRHSVEDIAALVDVSHLMDRRPRRLSGGERQRVALGRALLAAPRCLLLDEPFSALDRPLRAEIARRLDAHCRAHGIPRVVVAHDEETVGSLADERWVLESGRVRRDG